MANYLGIKGQEMYSAHLQMWISKSVAWSVGISQILILNV